MTQRTVILTDREVADLAIEHVRQRLGLTGPHAWGFDLLTPPSHEWGFAVIVEDGLEEPIAPSGTPVTFATPDREPEAL